MNLIFGSTDETKKFWNKEIHNQIKFDYDFKVNFSTRKDIQNGGLLFAILFNCKINLMLDEDPWQIYQPNKQLFSKIQILEFGVEVTS